MPFLYERKYKVYVILGKPGTGTPWAWSEWQAIVRLLQPVIDRCRAKPLLRSVQRFLGGKRWVQFGKLVWTDKHHAKWTHDSPETRETSKQWVFYNTELAAPSLPQSEREGKPPDFFFAVTNEAFLKPERPVAFNPRFFFALASDADESAHRQLRFAVGELSRRYEAVLTATIERPWGRKCGSLFDSAIQYEPFVGLFKLGDPHSRPVTLDTFTEAWEAA